MGMKRDQALRGEIEGAAQGAGRRSRKSLLAGVLLPALLIGACSPTVRVEAPKEPITINLNIQADVRVTLEEQAKKDITANPGVF
jgi:hypothetical protein